jgi:hypothetical protein
MRKEEVVSNNYLVRADYLKDDEFLICFFDPIKKI